MPQQVLVPQMLALQRQHHLGPQDQGVLADRCPRRGLAQSASGGKCF